MTNERKTSGAGVATPRYGFWRQAVRYVTEWVGVGGTWSALRSHFFDCFEIGLFDPDLQKHPSVRAEKVACVVLLRALDFWSAHHEKQIENESLDWSNK